MHDRDIELGIPQRLLTRSGLHHMNLAYLQQFNKGSITTSHYTDNNDDIIDNKKSMFNKR